MASTSFLHRARMPLLAGVAMFAIAPSLRAATTLDNMQSAFNGESNAHARYLAYANQADKEGYFQAASLFRAAARAEEVHALNHAEVIRKLGTEPKANIEAPQVKSTRENLTAAIKGETYERDTMYPEFLKQARADSDTKAVRSLNLAKTAEAGHAKLYQAALDELDRSKGTAATGFYVCPICGYTVEVVDFAKCPSCFTEKEKFEKVA